MRRKLLSCCMALLLVANLAIANVVPILHVKPEFHFNTFPLLASTATSLQGHEVADWWETHQDLYRRYYSQPGLLDLGFRIVDEHFGLVFDLDFRQAFESYFIKRSYSNIPMVGNTMEAIIDLNFPRVGYAEFKLDKFHTSFGRRQIKWGPAEYDFAVSDSAPYLDNLNLTYTTPAGNGHLWYNYMMAGFNTAVLETLPADPGLKTLFTHRLGWANGFMRIALGEMNLVYNQVPNVLDCTPFGIWHNLYQDYKSNVLMSVAIEALPFSGFRIYGTFGMDDFDLPQELANPNGKPAAMGFNAGFQLHLLDGEDLETIGFGYGDFVLEEESFKFKNGLNLTYECYFTTPYMYNRDVEEGKFTVPLRTFTFSYGYVDDENAFFIGFPYGPNTQLHRLAIDYTKATWQAFFEAEFMTRGDYGIDSPYGLAEFDGTDAYDYRFTLKGPLTKVLNISTGGEWYCAPGIRLSGRMDGSFDFTHDKQAFSASVGASLSLQDMWSNQTVVMGGN